MRARLPRLGLRQAVLALALAVPQAVPAAADVVQIGAREDTRPFIWRDAGTGSYLGFLWDVCTEAVQRAGYSIAVRSVSASERADFLDRGAGDLDLLCDPTTITLKRMQAFLGGEAGKLAFTQIIFVANASYALNPTLAPILGGENSDCADLGDRTAGTAATVSPPAEPDSWLARAERIVRLRPEQPQANPQERRFEIWGYVTGSTSQDFLATQRGPPKDGAAAVVCLHALASHQQAADAFCDGRLKRYYGDIDIVRAAIAEQSAQRDGACPSAFPEADGAGSEASRYEPYALVVSSSRIPDLPERISLAIYSMFTDATMDRLFAGHFPQRERNIHLDTLFRLNSIPPGSAP